MKVSERNIAATRLNNQHILKQRYSDPAELVRWQGAVQAQDYLGSLWAIGLRLKGQKETKIEKAISDKTIVRSWPMRGTLHFVPSEDLRWMLQLLTPRVIQRSAALYREMEFDKKVFSKCRKIIVVALQKEKQLSRPEIYSSFEAAKISTANQRGLHILGHFAQEGLICFGPKKDKQHGFVLTDEWLPASVKLSREEGLAKLAVSYFQSHGPATIYDFAWWSGLTIADAKVSISLVKSKLVEISCHHQSYYLMADQPIKKSLTVIALLPSYDEYFVGYKERSIGFDPATITKVKASGNGIFFAVLLKDGRMAGTWKRLINKKDVTIEINSFGTISHSDRNGINQEVGKMGKFLDLPVDVVISNGR